MPSFLEPRRRSEQALVAVVQEAYVNGVSTRKVERLVEQLGVAGMSKSQVSRLCAGLDGQVSAFRTRPLEGRYPYLCLRDMLGHVQKQQQQMVGAAIRQVFAASSRDEARAILTDVVARPERIAPKVARLLEEAEPDLLAFLDFPTEHRSKLLDKPARARQPRDRPTLRRRRDLPQRRRRDPPRELAARRENDEMARLQALPLARVDRRPVHTPSTPRTTSRQLIKMNEQEIATLTPA
jgi:hypothetical protein